LIEGPLGAGKTTIASLIHQASEYIHEPFIVHTCTAHYETQEHIKNSVEEASGGCIVFQDIDVLDEDEQKYLLTLIHASDFKGRVIATSRFPDQLNESLRSRIGLENLTVPSIKDRKQDIPELLDVYVRQIALELGVVCPKISKEVVALCENYEWQGNLYELQAAMIWALVHNNGAAVIQPESLPVRISGLKIENTNVEVLPSASQGLDNALLELSLREAREVFEREYLTSQVERFEGNISKTAQFIGMERSALHRKIKSLQEKSGQVDAVDQPIASVQT